MLKHLYKLSTTVKTVVNVTSPDVNNFNPMRHIGSINMKKVQVGKDQEKAQSEKDSHSKNRGGKKLN